MTLWRRPATGAILPEKQPPSYPGFVVVEVLCGALLILGPGSAFVFEIADQRDAIAAFTLIPTWAFVNWAWRNGRLVIAWTASAYPLGILAWLMVGAAAWLTQGQYSIGKYDWP